MNKSRKAFATCAVSAALLGQNILFSQNIVDASSMNPNISSSAYNSNNIFTQCGYKGQCTWFTYGRVLEKLGTKLPSQFYGNAIDWWYSNIKYGIFSYDSQPRANSIIVWSGGPKGFGHVGFVEKVVGDTIYYNEGNVEKRGYYDGYVKTISKQAIKNRGNLFLKGYIYVGGNPGSNSSNSNNNNNNYNIIKTSKVSCSSLNVRNNPSLSSSIIGGVSKNQTVSIISESNGWSKIKYSSGIGYVSSKYLSGGTSSSSNNGGPSGNSGSSSNETVQPGFVKLSNTNSSLNVRNSGSLSASIIGSLKHGSSVSILGKTGSWYKIKYGSKIGYVNSDYISSNNSSKTTISTKTNPTSSSNVTVTGKGTVKLSDTSSALNFRTGPSLSSSISGSLSNGASVDILEKTGSWYKVRYGSKIGYVSGQYITTSKASTTSVKPPVTNKRFGTVHLLDKYSTLNVRKNAGTNSSVISSLGYGSKVEILSSSGDWYKIKFNNTTGYVYSKYLTDTSKKVMESNQGVGKNTDSQVVRIKPENKKRLASAESKEIEQKIAANNLKDQQRKEAEEKAEKQASQRREVERLAIQKQQTKRQQTENQEASKQVAVKHEVKKQDTEKQEAAKQQTEREAAQRKEAERQQAEKEAAQRREAARQQAEREATQRREAARQQAEREGAQRREAARQQAEREAQKKVAPSTHGNVVSYAMQFKGTPYVWGGTTPKGFDCSGFVQYVYRNAAGIQLARDTYGQVNEGVAVSRDQLQPGDLVFPSDHHVGIYIGGGQMIHSPKSGDVVKISSIWSFYAGRRIR
ncbi:SH3 domain-containing protein [Clostridium sp. Marseille-Q2269]|uniref:SH3 domain-containing protein n=1 Tax=Clostridium sp. Marseille-Q2269 TaxID=2942205 RepID=UPI002072ACC6|nr:SH3 domain-containing protein [Clostridium sp. Marseille-Q2269]